MEIKHSMFWSYILCQALLVIPSESHSNNGSLGNIEFVCPQGQYFTGGFCIMPVDVEMDWWSARRTCERHGYYLFWADDVDDYIAIDHLARSSWTNYWSGLYDIGGPKWVYKSKEAPLHEVLWENGQPAADAYQYCVYAKKNGYYSFGNCLQKLPFICKSHAVLKDYFRCRNGEGIKQEFVCDGHNDCGDFSDEIKCGINTPQCSGVVDAQTVNSGSISSSGVYGSSKSCYWTIVAGVGQTIKVIVKTFGTEKSADILHLRTGGMGGDIYLGELTGTAVNPLPTYYSSDNVFILRLITDNTIESTGFTIDWTTNVPEVFNDVKMLRAGNSVEDLKSPFYDSGYLPHEKVLEWVITADTNHVVTLEFVDIKIGDSGQLFLWDSGDKTQVPTLNGVQEFKSSIYISKSKSVRLMLRSEGGGIAAFNKGLYVRYWEGCNVNHQLNEGTIQSPGYFAGNYPDNVNCQWSMRSPQGETRPISLRFKSFDLQSESDHLKIFNDSASSVSSSPLHTGDGFNGLDDLANMVVHSTTGSIWIKFETNAVLTAKGFEAEFSVDCPAIVVSSYTSISSNEMYETSFRSEVILTCDTGYSFKQEEFNKMSSVTIMCEKGGKWNVSRIPDCMITFCPIPPNIENGYILISSGVMYGANVTYECNDGFSLNQNNVIECMENGAWSSAPTCQAEQCPTLTPPTNGGIEKLEGDGTEFASVVRFTCDEGYDLIGNLTIYCKTGGEWSHERPVCERIWCPLTVIHDGSLDRSEDMRFGMSATLTCDTGYGINGTTEQATTATCGADGRIEYIPCMDIDECDTSTNNCAETENCNNINGSFLCTCKDGYEKLSMEADCTDIDECKLDPKPCELCENKNPGYQCSCGSGYQLYTEDGFNNISLADGESGLLLGDVYRINHTCVKRLCPLPSDIVNGKVLTKKELIFYKDKVEYVCNHGFTISDATELECKDSGSYSLPFPTCSVATCLKPTGIERAVEVYPVTTAPSVDYGTEVNIECQYGSQKINRTLYCSYNVITGQYELMGDAPVCPEIDCGEPEVVPGSVYMDKTVNVLGSTFTFDCDNGFDLRGNSLDGTTNVTCQENGRWNLGNLTCIGGRCSDPGTPGGAVQVVDSYEVGQLLSFNCTNTGYYPSPPGPWECIVDDTGTVNWNTTDLPVCADITPPEFSNCPTEPIYIDKSESYSYATPTATDNSGSVKQVKKVTEHEPQSGNANNDISITYRAEDYSGNTANCTVEIKIKDYANHALNCSKFPANVRPIYTAEGITYNVSEDVSVLNNREDITIQYSPSEMISLDHTDVGNPQIVEVTATDKWGGQDTCRFHLETTAVGCFKESFPNVQHGSESCTSGNVSCTLTCDTGYILFDGNSSRTYDCERANIWTPALPPQYGCIGYEEPAYMIEFMVHYTTVQSSSGPRKFAANCSSGLKQLLLNDLKSALTSEIHGACNNDLFQAGDVEITDVQCRPSSFDWTTTFTFKLLNALISDEEKNLCGAYIKLRVKELDFLNFTVSVTCDKGTSQVNRKGGDENKVLSEGNSCTAGIQKLTDIGEKCIKCPPGTFSSGGDVCTECPDGQFQNLYGMTSCKTCPQDTPVPSADKTTCLDVCPPGFRSENGLPSCQPCPEDTYWVNRTYCEACPDNGKTLGFDGVAGESGCKLPCQAGQYSVTGYAPCKMCPVNFYQDEMAQDMCKECFNNQITQTTGSKSGSDCITLGITPSVPSTVCCEVCLANDTVCCANNCNQNSESLSCKNRCTDGNNNTLSCQCNSACIGNGNCCDDYGWTCLDSNLDCNNPSVCNGQGSCSYNGHETVCDCVVGYVGERCETEVDPCSSSPCWNGGTCIKTGVDTYNCSCPVDTSCKMVREEGKTGNDADWARDATQTKSQPNTEACEQFCLDSPRCLSVHYTEGHCFVYNKLTTTEDKTGSMYSLKQCTKTPLFGNERCKDDLINSCKNNTCSDYGMCQDLLEDKAKCLCPVTGVFTGDKCEKDTDLCNPDPCPDATCVSYDSVRYQCVCNPGYSGENCDVNIDECNANPNGCLYNSTCVDRINSYECTCKSGFHGDRCKDIPNFCSANPCPEGICFGDYEKFDFTCKCEKPYRLASDGTCEMIPSCEGVECVNGTCGSDGRCDCTLGFEGSLCQHNIDDCRSRPCQHRGQCTDLLNDYVCDCPPGYDGKNCDNNIDDCVGMCGDSNVESCEDLIDDYRCVCKPGYTGRNCTDDIDECWNYPCRHSGECSNLVNDYSCQCSQGWTGKQCELPEDFCNSSPCKHEGVCYNMTDGFFCRCQGGTKGTVCEDFPDVCNVIKPCTNSGQCKNVGGTAECSCSDNYAGSSCQLIDNQCEDDDTCKNDGMCTTNDVGFQCQCPSSYSGSTCDAYTDPCSSNPCHNTAKCTSDKHRYLCYCQNGGYLTDDGCKDLNNNFDLYMDDSIPDLPGFLRTPLIMPQDSDMTIMFWFRVIGPGSTLLTLEEVSIIYPFPLFQTSILMIKTNMATLTNSTSNETVDYGKEAADGKWHFFVLSWERNGNTRVFIDSISIVDKVTVSSVQLPKMLQVIFGSNNTNGRISQLRIYRSVFSVEDIYQAIQGLDHLQSENNKLVQVWANLAYTKSTFRKYPSQVKKDVCDKGFPGCPENDDRMKPTVSCPENKYATGNTSHLTLVSGLKNSATFSDDTKVKNSSIHEDEVFTFGRTNEVFVGYDEAKNYAICRFKVYIKYFSQCPTPDTDADISRCSDGESICNLTCRTGKSLSLAHRNQYTCSHLGVFNYQHPWKQFVLPTCGGETAQYITLSITLKYSFKTDCFGFLKDQLKSDLEEALNKINDTWNGISCNGNCIVNTSCVAAKSNEVEVELLIPELSAIITKNGQTYQMREAILIVILQEGGLETEAIQGIAGAKLLNDSVMVSISPSCSSGYVVLGDTCVQCGKGTYRNDTTMTCEFCPVGTYQVHLGRTTCQSCDPGKTTLTYGSYLQTDCVDDCPPGKFYSMDLNSCTGCAKDHYQDMSGQEFCHRCPLGFKTSIKGSNSSSNCKDDCEAGTELKPDGSCKICPRGYYRTQNDDKCVSCPSGYTTEGESTKSSSDCNIRICYAGNFRNVTINECMPCPVGWYQSEDLQDECDKCQNSYTTDGEGKTHQDNCTFYCPAGEEVLSAEQEKCRPCPRGSYRSTEPNEILMQCINCTAGNTTESVNSVSSDQCSIRRCNAGQALDAFGECMDCPVDTYQSIEMPTSSTKCVPCSSENASPRKGTVSSGVTRQEDCKVICREGEQNDGVSCSPCPQGTWNNGNDKMRFEMCSNCYELWTTVGQGSTHADNCTLRDCDPGYYIDGNNCTACGFAQYQPNRHASVCYNCSENQNTSSTASTQLSACQIYCGAGESGTADCQPCAFNSIKPSPGIAECEACTGNVTSNDARTACSELYCDVGLYNESGMCIPCGIGKYKDQRGNENMCTQCDAGYTTAGVGSDSESDCNVLNCVPGKFKNDTSNMCEPCPVKTYKSSVGNNACTDCANDKTTNDAGSTSSGDCSLVYCNPGQKRTISNVCEDCPVGWYQPEYGKSVCLSCGTGYTTSDVKTENLSDCHEICRMGFSFNDVTKMCDGCQLGYYKPVVGNEVQCTQCPTGNTTAQVNSTSEANCNISDCLPGSKRDGGGCTPCEKGTFQNETSATSCISCSNGYTTENSGSKNEVECILDCTDGKEYNLGTKLCEDCLVGFHTNRPTTEKCVQCPTGQTTLYAGSNNCVETSVTTPPQSQTTSFKITYKFSAVFNCEELGSAIQIYISKLQKKVINRLMQLEITYAGLCGPGGCNISIIIEPKSTSCPAVQGKRQRRAAGTHDLEFDVIIPNITTIVTSTNNKGARPAASVLQEDVKTNEEAYNPEPDSLTPAGATVEQIVECGEGKVPNQRNCDACPAGTKKNSTDDVCVDCPINYYQDLEGQNSCKQCTGVTKYTLGTNSTSCVSECVKTDNYCNSHGSCREDAQSVYCDCNTGYEGTQCESRAASSTPTTIGGVIGGCVVLLLVILVTVLVCRKYYPSKKKGMDKRQQDQLDDFDFVDYYNPMYTYGRPRDRPMKALRFDPDWETGHNPYQPYMGQNGANAYDSESYYTSSPHGRHEWRATSE